MVTHPVEELFGLLPEADIRNDAISRLAYAHDASSYRLVPQAIVHPHNSEDIKTLLWWSNRHKIPLTFRTAGTSLSGQAVSKGVIVDVSRWKNLSIEKDGLLVKVSPGYIGGMVNARLKKYGKKIGPDPASINSCMMGGIIANNASGMCCGVHHNSYHTLHSISFLLPDGTHVNTSNADAESRFMQECPLIYSTILHLRDTVRNNRELADKIRHKYKIKNTVGYGLNSFLDYDKVTDILGHLMVGSEGTLGFIEEVALHTIPEKPYKRTGLLFFRNVQHACRAIEPLTKAGAEALELMDRASLRSVEDDPITPTFIKKLDNNAACLLVEFQAESEYEVEQLSNAAYSVFETLTLIEQPVLTDDISLQNTYWKIRKGMFPTVGAKRPSGTGIINEDIAFPVERLSEGVEDLHALFDHYNYKDAIVFGHAKDGNLHFVIAQAFDTEEDIRTYQAFMNDLADLIVHKYNGSLKAEHGTGRNIAPFVEMEWGEELYTIMRALKSCLDPNNILNPGIIINNDPLCHIKNLKPFPEVEKEINKCIECGFCENKCPSKELTLTPRQRIVIRREESYLSQQNDNESQQLLSELRKNNNYSVIDTCATDGLCEISCPVHINTGTYVKNLKKKAIKPFSRRVITYFARHFYLFESIAKCSLRFTDVLHLRKRSSLLLKLSRIVHSLTNGLIPQWSNNITYPAKSLSKSNNNADIVLFSTCSSRLLGLPTKDELSLSETILELCNRAKVAVHIPKNNGVCCGMMWDSKGYDEAATDATEKLFLFLKKESRDFTIPIVFDTSSCFVFVKEQIIKRSNGKKPLLYDISEFLMTYIAPKLHPIHKLSSIALHIPCSLEKNNHTQTLINVAKEYSDEVYIPEFSGCCGFAGDKGFNNPELNESAVKHIKNELLLREFDGYYSTNTTCEIGMSEHNMPFRSIAYLLEKTTRPIRQ